jgi:hypothetical protein
VADPLWAKHRPRIGTALLASLTLGLAPFVPHAHIWKQLVNLHHGTLTAREDVVDLLLHGAPWVWLLVALAHFGIERARR